MHSFLHCLIILFGILPGFGISAQEYKIMTYNIRFANPGDGEDRWELRKQAIVDYIRAVRPVVVGTQEGRYPQLEYMDDNLESYDFVGVGRDRGDTLGEHTALFFDASVVELMNSGTFWLSETGDTGTLGWDAAITRICTYARFRDRASGKEFKVFNGHFDHIGQKARQGSARQIVDSAVVSMNKGMPVIVLGDFNSEPETRAFRILNKALPCAAEMVPGAPSGPPGTYTAFDTAVTPTRRIDHIFISGFVATEYEHQDPRTARGRGASDHLPVVATLAFE